MCYLTLLFSASTPSVTPTSTRSCCGRGGGPRGGPRGGLWAPPPLQRARGGPTPAQTGAVSRAVVTVPTRPSKSQGTDLIPEDQFISSRLPGFLKTLVNWTSNVPGQTIFAASCL